MRKRSSWRAISDSPSSLLVDAAEVLLATNFTSSRTLLEGLCATSHAPLNPRLRCFHRLLAQCSQHCLARTVALRSFVFFVSHLSCFVGPRLLDALASAGTMKITSHNILRPRLEPTFIPGLFKVTIFCSSRIRFILKILIPNLPASRLQPQNKIHPQDPLGQELSDRLSQIPR